MAPILNPILLDLPDMLETERLILRPLRPGDGRVIHESVVESLPELIPWMPWATEHRDRDESEIYARRAAARFVLREDLALGLFRRSDGAHVGNSGLHRIDWMVPKFEIGYWQRTSMQGQGYITEAVRAITQFAFTTLQAERVEIRCDARNRRSAAVAERAGYPLEARRLVNVRDHHGELRDTLVYALTRARYLSGVATR